MEYGHTVLSLVYMYFYIIHLIESALVNDLSSKKLKFPLTHKVNVLLETFQKVNFLKYSLGMLCHYVRLSYQLHRALLIYLVSLVYFHSVSWIN